MYLKGWAPGDAQTMPPAWGVLLAMERIARHLGAEGVPAAQVTGVIYRMYTHNGSKNFFDWAEMPEGGSFRESHVTLNIDPTSGQYVMDLSGRRFVHDPTRGEATFLTYRHLWDISSLFTKDNVVYLILQYEAMKKKWVFTHQYATSEDVSKINKWDHLGEFAKTAISELMGWKQKKTLTTE